MKLVPTVTAKTLGSAEEKELLVFEFAGDTTVATKLHNINEFDTLVAVLSTTEDRNEPHVLVANSGTPCISYGTEWTLELLPSLEVTIYPAGYEKGGTVVIAKEGAAIRLARDPGNIHTRGRFWMLDQWKPRSSLPDAAFGIRRWRIWPSEEERTNRNGSPIVDFDPHRVT